MIADDIIAKMVDISQSFQAQSPEPSLHLSSARKELETLTLELMRSRRTKDTLLRHPFSSIRERSIPISDQVSTYVHGATVLITGAGGTVGSALSDAVAKFRPAKIILLDRRSHELALIHERMAHRWPQLPISMCKVDIRFPEDVFQVFEEHRPQIIYHLAAQREPGRAEQEVPDTIQTNILGTQNLTSAANRFGAERFIYTSSGKSRFIYENRVYAATKKYGEALVKIAARHSPTRFSVVRFHHLVENSIVEKTFASQIAKDAPLTVHFPPRIQPCQSLQEAVAMLLNAGVCGANGDIFAVAREVERFSILDLALYSIKASGQRGPIVFKVPHPSDEYQSAEFGGTRRTNHPNCTLHGFNMVETQAASLCDGLQLERAAFPDFDAEAAQRQINDVLEFTAQAFASGEAMKERLYWNLSLFATDLYARAPLELVLASIRQGVQHADADKTHYFGMHKDLLMILLMAVRMHDRADFSLQDQDTLLQTLQVLENRISGHEGFHDLLNHVRQLRTFISK